MIKLPKLTKIVTHGGQRGFVIVGKEEALTETQAAEVIRQVEAHEGLVEALEQIRDLETECCSRCEGNGRLYADGKAHFLSENADTILCGNCGGSGRILPDDAQDIAEQALSKEKE